METLLTDAGPLVALLNHRDEHHEWARQQFGHFSSSLLTCEGAIAEAAHLLHFDGLPQQGVLELIERKIISIQFDLEPNLNRVLSLMNKYADTPMDFVDACLVAMTEQSQSCKLLTLDSDFKIYRRFERQMIPLITPK
ncbi:MAG TPA: PIN domain-containing protein [Candidatus Sulfotelmatobacter sp.]|jgi:predicted nucleic acid-binding protein|nr:PIN domain-containing protein [Candidatus Sulfotelmatobacter sp.]